MTNEVSRAAGGAEQFSRDDAIAAVVGTALTRFTSELDNYRRILDHAATNDKSSRNQPEELRRLGRTLTKRQKQAAETAALEFSVQIRSDLENLFAISPEQVAAEGRHYPVAPEQFVVMFMVLEGPQAITEHLTLLKQRCDDDPGPIRYALAYVQWTNRDPAETLLGKTLLPGVVISFEMLLAALVRLWLTLHPEGLGVGNQQMSVQEALDYHSKEDLQRWAIDRRVDEFVNKRPEEWDETLAERLKIRPNQLSSDWGAVLESFARRNAVVHAGSQVDQKYLTRLPNGLERPKLGTPLVCDEKYLIKILDLMAQLGTSLAIAWVAHFLPRSPNVAELAIQPVVRALWENRWQDAKAIAEIVLKDCGPDHNNHELRINLWMARQELKDDTEALKDEIEAWIPPVDEPRYRLAKCALLWDEQGALAALKDCEKDGTPLVSELSTWPLVRRMKNKSNRFATQLGSLARKQRTPPNSTGKSGGPLLKSRRRR